MNAPPNRSVEQLAEVLATLAASSTEAAAMEGSVERIAECFESEIGALVGGGTILASVGFRREGALPQALIEVASGDRCGVDVPGAGFCGSVVVPVPSERPCRLVLARSGDGFSLEEVSLLRSMGRILATALDMVHLRVRVAASESRFRRIVETANEGIWLLDTAGATTFANDKIAEILGYPPEDMVGLTIFDVLDDQGKPHAARNLERRREGLNDQFECAFVRRDGTYVWVLLNASPLSDGDGAYVGSLCMVSDISPRKRIEQELAGARDAAMESSRLKSDFLATMSHEIRTPMNGVIGLTGLLLTTELDERQRQYADGVRTAGEGLLAIINDILDLSKIEAGRLELEVIDFDLVQVVEEAAGLVATAAQRKGLELMASCAPGLPGVVRGDPARLRQVLLNLASNAVKFTSAGEVVIRADRVRHPGDGVAVRFEVADTGIGISDADARNLFQAFTQADASTTRRFGGTGLGLVISRRLVAAMDGELCFESTPGQGSKFWFTLPLPQGSAVPVGAAPAATHPRGLRVMIVDDNQSSRRILADQLGAWGLTCEVAADGPDALVLLREASGAGRLPDVVLLDASMPGMGGIELATRISSDPTLAKIRLVLLTSAPGIAAVEIRRFGISACLTKPVRMSHLAAVLEPSVPGSTPPVVRRTASPLAIAGHILVVEDNANNQLVATGILRLLGYRADVAANGFEALDVLARTDYDAILMDCQMPEMDGFTATGEIRNREGAGRHTPIIAMTAGATDADRERCLAAGMDDFLAKPVRPGDVEAALARWVVGERATPAPPVVDEPPRPPVLDDDFLDELAGIDDEGALLARIVDTFLDGTPEHLAELADLVAGDDAAAVGRAAHRLRGSSGNVGALEVTRLLADLEERAAAGGLEGAPALLDGIVAAFERAAAAMADRRNPRPQSVAEPTPEGITEGALDHLPEAALRLDRQGRLVKANRLAVAMCASSPSGTTATLAEAVMAVSGFRAWLGGSGGSAGDGFRGRLQGQRENGVPLTLEVSARRFPGPAGGATCLFVEFDRERVATEAQRYFDVAFDAAPIGMALFNTDGEYVRVNRSLCTLLGRREAELLGHRDQEFTHPDDRQRDVDAAWRILRGEISTWQSEKRFLRPDGQVVWTIANLTFLRDADDNPVSWVGQFQDITERQRASEQLARALAAAVVASRLKSEFVANMSHEIRTPLNGVIGMTSLLLGTELSERQREYADAAGASGDALLRVVDDVLDFAKIEAGKLDIASELFDVHDLVADVSTIVAAAADAKGVELAFRVDDTVPGAVRGDANRVHQVLSNLLSNAVKFTAEGVVAVEVSAAVDRSGAAAVRFEVRDTGIGIEPAAVDRIFDSFSQADGSTTRRFGGTGLGLTISRQLVGLMGGTIGVESAPGRGSTFWFVVPLPVDAGAVDDAGSGKAEPGLPAGVRVLVVEGHATTRANLERQLRSWGAECSSAGAGQEGLAMLASAAGSGQPFAVAFVDSSLTEMTATGFAEAVSADPALRSVRLVLLTAARDAVDGVRWARFEQLLAKPVRPSRLRHSVLAVLGPPPPGSAPVGPVRRDQPSPSDGKTDGARGAVLVVEDNLINQLVAVSMLEQRGFDVDVANNGREALDWHARRTYRLILMDGHMPEVDGYEATAEIRRREGATRHTPIVALTAGARADDRQRCLAAGMDDYLSKPVSQRQLDVVLERVVPCYPIFCAPRSFDSTETIAGDVG